jgi:hypothetical protein
MASAVDLDRGCIFGNADGARRKLRECITIVLDPGRFLTRLGTDHICDVHKSSTAAVSVDQMLKCRGAWD